MRSGKEQYVLGPFHTVSRFRSVTVPSSFRQNGLCSHCPSCSVTFQNSTW